MSAYDAAKYAALVDVEVNGLKARRQAKRIVDAEERGEVEPFDAGLLVDVLARPPEPPSRVEGLIPSEAGTLVVAQRKTGKTTLTLNLARSLLTGAPFLGRFATRPVTGRVGFLNFEVSAQMLGRWAAELHPAIPTDRLYLVNVRGRRNPLAGAEDREQLAKQLREHDVESLIVDPFGRAFTGTSQNDSSEVGAFLSQLDTFARSEAGVVDLVLTTHAGWAAERTRGSSALEDWADSIVTLTRDPHDATQRYLRAEGRDVLVDEDRLAFDAETRTLSLTGAGSRRTSTRVDRLADLVPAVVEVVTEKPGAGVGDIIAALRQTSLSFQDHEVRIALMSAGEQLLIERRSLGPGKKTEHYPVQPRPTPSTDAVPTTPSTPVYRDGVGVGLGQANQSTGRGMHLPVYPTKPGEPRTA